MSKKYCLRVWMPPTFMGTAVFKNTKLFVSDYASVIEYKEYLEEKHDHAVYKIHRYRDIGGISEEVIDIDGYQYEIKHKNNKVTIKATGEFAIQKGKRCTIFDTGNGYIVKFYDPHVEVVKLELDYDHAEYLLLGLQKLNEKHHDEK